MQPMEDPSPAPIDRGLRNWCAWLVIAQVWAFVLFLPQLKYVTSASNRYFLHWTHATGLLQLACTVLAGLLIFAVGWVLARCFRPAVCRGIGALAALAACSQLFYAKMRESDHPLFEDLLIETPLAFFTGVALVLLCASRGWTLERWGGWLATLSLIASPVVLVFWLGTIGYHQYRPAAVTDRSGLQAETRLADHRPADGPPQAENVYLFVFDAWPHRLTFEGSEVRDNLPALAEFAGDACVFGDAHAPGCHTVTSMPRLLYQRTDMFGLRGGEPGFFQDGQFRPTADLPSLFTQARAAGYRTSMVGWYHPYHALLAGAADETRSVCYYDHLGEKTLQRARAFYWSWGVRTLGSRISRLTIGSYGVLRNHAITRHTRILNAAAREVLERPETGQFAVFHLTMPHWPFCMHRNGFKELDTIYSRLSEEGAVDQVEYLDRWVGETLQMLKDRGKYDGATIIMTSDHTWRKDPQIDRKSADAVSHVPLLIKLPGQRSAVHVATPFSTVRLSVLLDAIEQQGAAPADVARLAAEGDHARPLPDTEVGIQLPMEVP